LAPTDDTFLLLGDEVIDSLRDPANLDNLTAILTNHIVGGVLPTNNLQDQTFLTSINGLRILVTIDKEGGVNNDEENIFFNQGKVVISNILASNGIIHEINSLLLEDGVIPSNVPSDMSSSDVPSDMSSSDAPSDMSSSDIPTPTLLPTITQLPTMTSAPNIEIDTRKPTIPDKDQPSRSPSARIVLPPSFSVKKPSPTTITNTNNSNKNQNDTNDNTNVDNDNDTNDNDNDEDDTKNGNGIKNRYNRLHPRRRRRRRREGSR
jgi:Fasciclin domain